MLKFHPQLRGHICTFLEYNAVCLFSTVCHKLEDMSKSQSALSKQQVVVRVNKDVPKGDNWTPLFVCDRLKIICKSSEVVDPQHILQRFKRATEVEVFNATFPTVPFWPEIERLILRGCDVVNSAALQPSITHLTLDESHIYAASWMPMLSEVVVSHAQTSFNAPDLWRQTPRLKIMKVFGLTRGCSLKDVTELVQSMWKWRRDVKVYVEECMCAPRRPDRMYRKRIAHISENEVVRLNERLLFLVPVNNE